MRLRSRPPPALPADGFAPSLRAVARGAILSKPRRPKARSALAELGDDRAGPRVAWVGPVSLIRPDQDDVDDISRDDRAFLGDVAGDDNRHHRWDVLRRM